MDHREAHAKKSQNGSQHDPGYSTVLRHPTRALAALYVAWKTVLFAIVANCPGRGYDTSTTLLVPPATALSRQSSSAIWNWVRWDAIYFVRVAERGYLFEQEWAWGVGYTGLLRHLSSAFVRSNGVSISAIAICGVAVSHVAHFLSVLVLHALTKSLFGYDTQSQKAFCLIAAALHVLSPAGAFLSAPYGESIFSLLNLTGFYLYASALSSERAGRRGQRDIYFFLAGIAFAVATTIRGNGILSGCLFAYDAVQGALQFLCHGLSLDLIRRTGFVVLGGITVALGSIIPQFIAFTEYCGGGGATPRPWCKQLLPSIYGWVQAHYWNVGFMRYWTISNLPLFILAAPMLVTMLYSSFVTLTGRIGPYPSRPVNHVLSQSALAPLAIAQGILALMALSTFHVQIINRIASGYPVWYWSLSTLALRNSRMFGVAVQAMAMYALIQAVLFASFLPPA